MLARPGAVLLMGFSGSGIGQIRASLAKLASVPARAAKDVAEKIDQKLLDSFTNECDAYGRPWAPLAHSTVKRKNGNSVIMYRTGASMAATHAVAARGAGVRISTGPNMAYHLGPSGTRPARPILPIYGMPASWNAAIKSAVDAAYSRATK
ncbi:MAG: hypothetical protein WCJ30_17095 [Deltaproteobacteria bacterium]